MEDTARRDAEIRSLGLLDHTPPDVVVHLLHAARLITGASDAQFNVLTEDSQVTVTDADRGSPRVPLADAVCPRVMSGDEGDVSLPDASQDPRYADAGIVARGDLVGYAATRLVSTAGVTIGTVCVFSRERLDLSPHMIEALHQVGLATVAALEARRSTAQLGRTNDHLSTFAGQVAHDLQGPLATIIVALRYLQESLTAEGQPFLLGTALSGAERLRLTVSALLEFAQLGGHTSPVVVALDDLVADVLQDLGPARGRVQVSVDPLPQVQAVPALLRAVVLNLVDNAFKYAGDGPAPRVRISGGTTPEGWCLEVEDDGPGVPPSQRESVFEPMTRGSAAGDRDGIGIGLATCRRFAEAHGGTIAVDDSVLGGARFRVEWPAPPSA